VETDPALRDELTGLANRRRLREILASEWPGLLSEHGRVALLLLDLDLFKEVNDRHGHLAGDEVLVLAATRLRDGFRASDRLVRYGGDEFVAVLPGLGAEEARALAERVRHAFTDAEWTVPGTDDALGVALSFSIGAAVAPDEAPDGESTLELADRRLYAEKEARRKRRALGRRLKLAAAALVPALVLVSLAVSRTSPEPPDIGAPAPEVARPLAPPTDSEADEALAAEIESLRAEVDRLQGALAEERSDDERHVYESRIAELESALAEARRRAEQRAPAGQPVAASVSTPVSAAPLPGDLTAGPARTAAPLSAGERQERGAATELRSTAVRPRAEAPSLIRHDPPVYPSLARRIGREGVVEFRVRVDEEGRVVDVEQLGEKLGLGLDVAARRAAFSARYRPASRDGVAVPGETTLTIRFVLTD